MMRSANPKREWRGATVILRKVLFSTNLVLKNSHFTGLRSHHLHEESELRQLLLMPFEAFERPGGASEVPKPLAISRFIMVQKLSNTT